MLREEHKLVSCDDHVIEPPNVWVDRMPAKFNDRGPRVVDRPGHTQAWQLDGDLYPISLLGSPRTRIFRTDGTGDDLYARHYDDMVPGAYDVKERLVAMDEDGVWAQLLFPTFPRFSGTLFIKHKDAELASACIQAYNDWMIDEWC
ncbi:MAG: amidohydrolase, partial [Acidimicrobiales bacterium]|nr:amidohydrolase [Acidimicrobiales bacterium]